MHADAACACAALGPVSLAAHTIVKQIIDFAMAIFGCFSTVAQSLVATCLGKVTPHQGCSACQSMFPSILLMLSPYVMVPCESAACESAVLQRAARSPGCLEAAGFVMSCW